MPSSRPRPPSPSMNGASARCGVRHPRRRGAAALFLSLLVAAAAAPGAAALTGPVNRTIDDQKGDSVTGALPVYSPDSAWKFGPDCTTCLVDPLITDVGEAFDNSWHDATISPGQVTNVTLSFTGTAIYVFCILANQVPFATTTTNLVFVLDGQPAGTFLHEPDASSVIEYNAQVFSQTNLSNTAHTLIVSPIANATENSLVLFDRAVYTFDDTQTTSSAPGQTSILPSSSNPRSSRSATSSSIPTSAPTTDPSTSTTDSSTSTTDSSTPIAAIVGGAVGGIALIVGAFLFYCLYIRRRRRARTYGEKADLGGDDAEEFDPSTKPEPFTLGPVGNDGAVGAAAAHNELSSSALPYLAATTSGAGSRVSLERSATISTSVPGSRGAPASASAHTNGFAPASASAYASGFAPATASGSSFAALPAPGSKAALRHALQAEQRSLAQARAAHGLPPPPPSADVDGGSSSGGRPSVYPPSTVADASTDESALRGQVEALQAEVARLRAQNALDGVGDAPPPAYVPAQDGDGARQGADALGPPPHAGEDAREGGDVLGPPPDTNDPPPAVRLLPRPSVRKHRPHDRLATDGEEGGA